MTSDKPPKTCWRPYPFATPPLDLDGLPAAPDSLNKFSNAEHQRRRVVQLLRQAQRPMSLVEIAKALKVNENRSFSKEDYVRVRRYVMAVADPTHEILEPKTKPIIGWTLKDEFK